MKKVRLFLAVVTIAAISTACGGNNKKEKATADQNIDVIEVSIDDLLTDASQYEDQTVRFTATVDHTCKHGGKKLSVFGNVEGKTFKVIATDSSPVFETTLSGKTVCVMGVVRRVIETHDDDCDDGHECDDEHETEATFSYVVECENYKLVE